MGRGLAFFAIFFRPQNLIEITGDFVRVGSHLRIYHGANRDKPYHILELPSISKMEPQKPNRYVTQKGGSVLWTNRIRKK